MGKPQVSHAPDDSTRGPNPAIQPTPDAWISETFVSRQGEGKLTGTESFFIRTSGCNLRCWFCDTPYASWKPTGETTSVDSLVDAADESGCRHVVLTGGEPLLSKAIEPLTEKLLDRSFHVTIETAGTIDKPMPIDLLSLSPKLSASTPDADQHPRWQQLHEQRRMPIQTMKRLIEASKDVQVKFVVGNRNEMDELSEIVDQLAIDASHVFIMPLGITIAEMDEAATRLKPVCEEAGYQYCDRMQIRWYGNRRGT